MAPTEEHQPVSPKPEAGLASGRLPSGPVAIDVHTHIVPESFPRYVGRHLDAPWPSTVPAQACHRHVMVSGSVYRTVSHQCWDCVVRRHDMSAMRIGRQVLSPMPELLSYWLDPRDGAALCRFLNETTAAMVAAHPDSFLGLAAVPLQDLDLAIAELDHAVHGLGLSGVEIGGNIEDEVIGLPKFLPFFQAAAAWGAAVFVHPLRPTGMNRLVGGGPMEQVVAFPGETGLAAASLITGGTLAQLPDLRIAFSHGGGTLQALLPRMQHAWARLPGMRERFMEPAAAARSLFFDNLVYDAATIRRLVEVFGIGQVMVGTDYPFSIMENDPLRRLADTGLTTDVIDGLLSRNAARWLGLAGKAA